MTKQARNVIYKVFKPVLEINYIYNYCHDRARNVIPVLPLLFVSSLSHRH